MQTLTQDDLSKVWGISQSAIRALVSTGIIPYDCIKPVGGAVCLCPDAISRWMLDLPDMTADENYLENLRKTWLAEHPEAMAAIKEFGDKFAGPRKPKRYYLVPCPNKKLGTIWYVKYLDKGRLVPSKWSSGTSDREAAELWAVENRERILARYYERKTGPKINLYKTLRKYYERDSPFLDIDRKRGRTLGDKMRGVYHGFVRNQLVPYLRKNGIRDIDDIKTATLAKFQNSLLLKGNKSQTINANMSGVKKIFEHLIINEDAEFNPCAGLPALGVTGVRDTGCYEIDKIKGAFDKEWRDKRSYMLCLLVYTTGMRNSEIARIQKSDIVEIGGVKFIDIPESKSRSGERKMPLHDFVNEKLINYKAKSNEYIFSKRGVMGNKIFKEANIALAEFTGYAPESLEKENIVFKSGRHFWKTMMSAGGLGENAEEVFMGHKTSSDVVKNYNHRDKAGAENLAKEARRVFSILDKHVFG